MDDGGGGDGDGEAATYFPAITTARSEAPAKSQ